MSNPKPDPLDDALGMDQRITRRDFLNSTLLASGAVLGAGALTRAELMAQAAQPAPTVEDWNGPGGIGDYAGKNGDTLDVLMDAHEIRDGLFETLPSTAIDTGETYDCVVVGGGISGLAAALTFRRRAPDGMTCLVLDNHGIFGGETRRNEFEVDGQRPIAHQGFGVPLRAVSSQLPEPLLRVHRPEAAAPDVSGLERFRNGAGDAQGALWLAGRSDRPVRLLLRREVRPATGDVGDRSAAPQAGRRSVPGRDARGRAQGDGRNDAPGLVEERPRYDGDAISRRLELSRLKI